MSYWPSGGPEHSLYVYSGGADGSGFPVGYNTSHPLYAYRETLKHFGVSPRQLVYPGDPNFRFGAGPPDGVAGTFAAINWFNPRYPRLGVRVARHLWIFCLHFYFGGLIDRERPATNDLWSVPQLRSLNPDGSLTSWTNAEFRGPWNILGGVRVGRGDCGWTEWTGASLPDIGGYPLILRGDSYPAGMPGWLLENQGRAIPVTIGSPVGSITPIVSSRIELPEGCQLFGGDSGAPIVVESGGELRLWGHVLTVTASPAFAFAGLPDLDSLTALGHSPQVRGAPVTWQPATQTTLDELAALIDDLADGVAALP